jgi:diguanylate cyclase (GGDEF)-like protein
VRILIAEDDPVSLLRLERTLVKLGHEVLAVQNGKDAIAALLQPGGPLLAILDWMMPGADGVDVCRAVRERQAPYVYVILLTGRDRREDLVVALDSGADDFLTKPFDAAELKARLRSGMRVLDLQDGLLKAQEALRVEAMHDHLTGLWNRRMIVEQLGRELHRAQHESRPLAIALADVDFFKRVNDTHGHSAGDEVLREIALRIRSVVRGYDFVGRYGGEEFLVVLPTCDAVTARHVAERIRMRVEAGPIHTGDATIDVTLSLGLAWTGSATEDAPTLIEAADAALYRAKAAGRNTVAE